MELYNEIFKNVVCQPKKAQLSKIVTELNKLGLSSIHTTGNYGGGNVLGYFDGEFSMGDLLPADKMISAEDFLEKIKSINAKIKD